MQVIQKKFIQDAENIAFDKQHRKTIGYNISKYNAAVLRGKQQYFNLALAKQRAARMKYQVVDNLDKYLVSFAKSFENNGGHIIWAKDSSDAVSAIINLFKERGVKRIVKSKSMITEEIELNKALEEEGMKILETDLGEYIVQLDDDKPYHIVTPAMHKSKNDIALLFNKKFGLNPDATAEEITAFVRQLLREEFVQADAGITGANFLIADTGSVALTENEGNALMSIGFSKIHIAIAGIEKLIASMADLHILWPLLATHGTGQNMTVYNSIISGPKRKEEEDGPEEMYVVLLDNGRTNLLAQREQRSALHCIRCGACLNVCPVYKNIGGHSYDTTYSGPIGKIITPHLRGMQYKHLSFASSLCGACTEACPVKIPIHKILLLNRRDAVNQKYRTKSEAIMMKGYKIMMTNRKLLNMVTPGMKNIGIQLFFKKGWGPRRTFPKFTSISFNQYWRKKME